MGRRAKSAIIRQLNGMNFDEIEFPYVKKIVGELKGGVPLLLRDMTFDRPIFRAVIHARKPTLASFLGHPPKELVTGYQRCNPPGEPVFYEALDPATPLFEVNPRPGDRVYRSKWSLEGEVTVFQTSGWGEVEGEFPLLGNPGSQQVMSYIDTVFSAPIPHTFSTRHKVTAALVSSLRGRIQNKPSSRLGVVTYPSVADPDKGVNISIQPEIVSDQLTLDWVEELVIEDPKLNPAPNAEPGKLMVFSSVDFANEFTDGEVLWKNRGKRFPGEETGTVVEYHRQGDPYAWGPNGEFVDPI